MRKKLVTLLQKDKREFIEAKVNEKLYTPPYFKKMEKNNQEGPNLICKLPYLKPLRMHEVKELMAKDAQVIDVRDPTAFAGGHIPRTLIFGKMAFQPMLVGF